MNYLPIIGLEVHIQLKTTSKMFCRCPVAENSPPNTAVCPICLGHPGVLPTINKEAVRLAGLFAAAISGSFSNVSKFDRKNYFYPDLPKGYQISQYDLPVVKGGFLDVVGSNGERSRIRFIRAHLEEDAAKNTHDSQATYVDFNRGGAPLIEAVTEPDLRSPGEAKAFLQELRRLVRALNLSDGDMEKGQLRCDANISLRQVDENGDVVGALFNPKTEVKNMNSFRHVERALQYETQRQTKLWLAGTPPDRLTTRGWDDVKQRTALQRVKEEAEDYRYFPEPDLPPLELTKISEETRLTLPELPNQKRKRFIEEYGFSEEAAWQLTDDLALSDFTERVVSEFNEWTDVQERAKAAKLTANWILNKLKGLLYSRGQTIENAIITPENMAELLALLANGRLTGRAALDVLEKMVDLGKDPSQIMEEEQLGRLDDEKEIAIVIKRVIKNHPAELERYRAGEEKLLTYFMGQVMKETAGNADPEILSRLLRSHLKTK